MATTNLYLDKADRKGQSPIFLVYNYNRKKFKYFTGEKIIEKAWDSKDQIVKRNYTGHAEINRNLEILLDKLKKIIRDATFLNIQPTTEYVKSKLFEETGRSAQKNAARALPAKARRGVPKPAH